VQEAGVEDQDLGLGARVLLGRWRRG
jgi:hypothetical protein